MVIEEREQVRLRPSMRAPCRASPVHSSFGVSASNRPNTAGAAGPPVVSAFSPVRTNIRCSVRSSGAQPWWAAKIRRTCAAERSGFSFFNAAAICTTSVGVRGWHWRGLGTSASNPPRRHSAIHRSSVQRVSVTTRPNGSVCGWAAIARTIAPR
jgi:hypothetical protein